MVTDANGKEIRIGMRVRHTQQHHSQAFVGSSEVVAISGDHVHVKPINREHCAVHCSELLEVVAA